MKMKIMVIICSLWLVLPVLSFAQEKTETYPKVEALEQALKNAKFKSARKMSKNKAREEAKRKRRSEQEAKKAAKASHKRSAKEPAPNGLALEQSNENAKFKRGEEEFNNKENKDIRAEKRAEKREEKENERIKKAQDDQDKGEGPFKWKF